MEEKLKDFEDIIQRDSGRANAKKPVKSPAEESLVPAFSMVPRGDELTREKAVPRRRRRAPTPLSPKEKALQLARLQLAPEEFSGRTVIKQEAEPSRLL